jgi:hypothetical protein
MQTLPKLEPCQPEANFIQYWSLVPAMIIWTILHRGIGYQRANFGLLFLVCSMLCLSTLLWPSTPLLQLALVGLGNGIWQHVQSYVNAKRGIPGGDAYSPGTPWLAEMPFVPAFLTRQERLERFVEPLLVAALGCWFLHAVDVETGLWLLIAASGMRIRAAWEYALRASWPAP